MREIDDWEIPSWNIAKILVLDGFRDYATMDSTFSKTIHVWISIRYTRGA